MVCQRCGFEREEPFAFCPICGTQSRGLPPEEQRVVSALSSKTFFAICLLMSASTLFGVLGSSLSISNLVIGLLFTIFFWSLYYKANIGIANVDVMRCVSGTFFAQYILLYIVGAGCLIISFSTVTAIGMATSDPEVLSTLVQAISEYMGPFFQMTASEIVGVCWIVAALFMLAASIVLIFNICVMRKMHGFIQSVYKNVASGGVEPIRSLGFTKIWLLIVGVLLGVFSLMLYSSTFNIYAFMSYACLSAATIIGAIVVGNNFPTEHEITMADPHPDDIKE